MICVRSSNNIFYFFHTDYPKYYFLYVNYPTKSCRHTRIRGKIYTRIPFIYRTHDRRVLLREQADGKAGRGTGILRGAFHGGLHHRCKPGNWEGVLRRRSPPGLGHRRFFPHCRLVSYPFRADRRYTWGKESVYGGSCHLFHLGAYLGRLPRHLRPDPGTGPHRYRGCDGLWNIHRPALPGLSTR